MRSFSAGGYVVLALPASGILWEKPHRVSAQAYPVMWRDSRYGEPTVGKLLLLNRHAILAGMSGCEQRVTEFEACEVELVSKASPVTRLHELPTLVVELRDRGQVLIAQLVGFAVLAEVADVLASWLDTA